MIFIGLFILRLGTHLVELTCKNLRCSLIEVGMILLVEECHCFKSFYQDLSLLCLQIMY